MLWVTDIWNPRSKDGIVSISVQPISRNKMKKKNLHIYCFLCYIYVTKLSNKYISNLGLWIFLLEITFQAWLHHGKYFGSCIKHTHYYFSFIIKSSSCGSAILDDIEKHLHSHWKNSFIIKEFVSSILIR